MSYLIKAKNNHQEVEVRKVGKDLVCLRVPVSSQEDGVHQTFSKDFIIDRSELTKALNTMG